MKFLGTDFGVKYIIYKFRGCVHTVSFRYNILRGIYDVKIYQDGDGAPNTNDLKIHSTTPDIIRVISEVALLIKVEVNWQLQKLLNR